VYCLRDRIYNKTNIDGAFAKNLKFICLRKTNDMQGLKPRILGSMPTPAYVF
jgi:hypothetical protein